MEEMQAGPTTESHLQVPPENEDWEEDEDYDDEDDDDIDAEALEIARKLGEQLWADLSQASATNTKTHPIAAPSGNINPNATQPQSHAMQSGGTLTIGTATPLARKCEEAPMSTIRTILALLESDPVAKSTVASTVIPGIPRSNVLELLQEIASSAVIAAGITMPLSQILVTLARSEHLFGDLRLSNAASIQLHKGKRKRDELEDIGYNARALKRPYVPDHDLQTQVMEAVRAITQAIPASSTTLDPLLIASIRLQLHQVFLFAVTSSAGGCPEMHALQEISGLIQVIGVLSGIQIGQSPEISQNPSAPQAYPQNSVYPWVPGQPPPLGHAIGTAVYPCLISGCKKIFARLFSLRAHQRSHAIHRPFRCGLCPASFARNHDLKRHIKLHDRKAWKCGACQKVFSRRDAFMRHKNGSKTRGSRGDDCANADVIEVELHDEQGDVLREGRRAKLWNGLALTHANVSITPSQSRFGDRPILEEGEIQEHVILEAQGSVLSLHGILRAHVGGVLGMPVGETVQAVPGVGDLTGGQATLASVIARAQSQNLPSAVIESHPAVEHSIIIVTDTASSLPPDESSQIAAQSQDSPSSAAALPSLSMYGLSDEQTKLLELAIANAASAAQAQAEAEAALEEEDDEYDQGDDEGESEIDDAVPAVLV